MVPKSFTSEQDLVIEGEYLAGKSSLQLAKAYGVSHSAILAALQRREVPRRPQGSRQGHHAPKWKGGIRFVNNSGYVMVYSREFPEMNTSGKCYVLEHRLIMARHLGRALRKNERVHHRNGDRADNRLENLELWIGGHPAGQRDAHCPTCTCFT